MSDHRIPTKPNPPSASSPIPGEDRISRLPGWAQDEIHRLQELVARQENALAEGTSRTTRLYVADVLGEYQKPVRYVQNNEHIVFAPNGLETWSDRIVVDVSLSARRLIVRSLGDPLVVQPQAANSIFVSSRSLSGKE